MCFFSLIETPINPCNPSPCGSNAICKKHPNRDHAATCVCIKGYFGDPFSSCLKPGCATKNGPVAKKPCVFPFNYNDISYTKCTRDHHDQPWCSTEVDAYGKHVKGKWGNCDSNCGTGITSFGSLIF